MNWYKKAIEDKAPEGDPIEEDGYISPRDNSVSENLNNYTDIEYQSLEIEGKILYHGGRKKFDIEVDKMPSNGLFLSDNREVAIVNAMDASRYWRMKSLGADVSRIASDKIAEFYVNLKHPFIVDAKSNNWLDIPIPDEMRKEVHETMDSIDIDSIGKWAKNNNYDGVIIKNVMEGKGAMSAGDTYIVFNKNLLIPVQ